MERPTCETCPYWALFDSKGKLVQDMRLISEKYKDTFAGECRKEHPRNFLLTPGPGSTGHMTRFPETFAYEWCGEHPDFPAWIEFRKAVPDLPLVSDADTDIRTVGLSVRTTNAIRRDLGRNATVGDVMGMADAIDQIRGIGPKGRREIEAFLARMGITPVVR